MKLYVVYILKSIYLHIQIQLLQLAVIVKILFSTVNTKPRKRKICKNMYFYNNIQIFFKTVLTIFI